MQRLSLAVGALLLFAGCGDDDPTEASGGAGGAAGAAATGGTGGAQGPWGCVGHVVYPPAPAPALDIWLRFYHAKAPGDPATVAPFAGATIDACAKGGDCASPLASSITNAQGDASLTLPTPGVGFDGFLRARSSEIVTTDFHFFPPIADASHRFLKSDWQPWLYLPSVWQSLAQSLAQIPLDPTKGHVITTTMDCQGELTSEVTVTLDGAAAASAGSADSVFFNVPPGPIEVEGVLGDGTLVAKLTNEVAAGRIVALHFGPTPLP